MKVILTKESEYDFNESKFTAIPHSVFSMLVEGNVEASSIGYPKVIMFNDKEDYINNVWKHNVDHSKDVYVSTKGQIFCFIGTSEENETVNVTTDTEENS